ncbi:MAG: hypothetical protein IJ877_06675 [Candidatus Gastranaerophilales bacterium]|nr:hypothetical protein [Candidatus Gastranaerophilales bacterium]
MFEKFTQKSIDVIQSALNYASSFKHNRVLSTHLLMGLVAQTKGVQAKILNFDKINFGKLNTLVSESSIVNPEQKSDANIIFSLEAREILKLCVDLTNKLNSKFTTPQHIALALFLSKKSKAFEIIKEFDIDIQRVAQNLERMLDKSSDIKQIHPETEAENTKLSNINDFFREEIISKILSTAQSKVSASGYEIVGSEQIMQSILDNKEYKIVDILNKYSIDSETFSKKVSEIPSRSAEFENSEKQIIFTPNAFLSLMLAFDIAKESGSVSIQPEHIVLGILKSKKGIAYKIISDLLPKTIDFEDVVMKKLNDKVPETLAILKLARAEAMSFESATIGTEMILLGILSYGNGIASDTLRRLGITLRDARIEVEKLVKPQRNVKTLNFSPRAKKMLEVAYETAQEHKRTKIKSENILYGITKMPNCLAMKVLSNLGTDVLELQQGIKQELLGGMDL